MSLQQPTWKVPLVGSEWGKLDTVILSIARSRSVLGAGCVSIGHFVLTSTLLTGQVFMDTLSKVVGSQCAKARMERRGVRVAKPRNKAKTWAIKSAKQREAWTEFSRLADDMGYDAFVAELSALKALGRERAKKLIEMHAPLMMASLKASGSWDAPFPPPPWRETLGDSFSGALVAGDDLVLVGKLPLHPNDFPFDGTEGARAQAQFGEWRRNLKQQGVELYEAGCV